MAAQVAHFSGIYRPWPTLRLAASRVRMSKAEPMKTSNCDGLPTRWAKADAGNNGKYIAAVTAKNAKIISINGIPSSLYQALGDNVSLVFRAPNNKNTSPKTNDKWMVRNRLLDLPLLSTSSRFQIFVQYAKIYIIRTCSTIFVHVSSRPFITKSLRLRTYPYRH